MDDKQMDRMWGYRRSIREQVLSKTPLSPTILQYYGKLCRDMRNWPAKLAAHLGDAPRIGLHFFVWRELSQPEDFSFVKVDEDFNFLDEGGGLIRRRMENPSWDEFQAANEGRVDKEVGEWEEWDKLPGDMGRIRFFGLGTRPDLRPIRDILKKADETISAYLCLPGPSILAWRFYKGIRDCYGCGSDEYYRLLGLIALSQGYDYDDTEILVKEVDNWPSADQLLPFDQGFVHRPDGIRFPIDVYAIQDFVAAFKEAVNEWVPEELDQISLEIDESSRPPLEPGEPANVFQQEGDVWHMRYLGIEDAHFAHSDNFDVIVRLLRSPNRKMDGFELQGLAISAAQESHGTKTDGSVELIVAEASSEDDEERGRQVGCPQEPRDAKAYKAVKAEVEDLRLQIDAARENNLHIDKVEELQELLRKGEKYLKDHKTLGPPPETTKAYRTVGTSIRRAIATLRPKMPCFADYLEEKIQPIPDKQKWVYCPGEDIHWVTS
jgi:hypothetical protein